MSESPEDNLNALNADALDTLRAFVDFEKPGKDGEPDFWNVIECGHWETDFERGACFAKIAKDFSKIHTDSRVINLALAQMVQKGRLGAIEMGFIVAIGEASRAGTMN